ncbi:hypothetical protein SLNSH_23855 [Alsobacter soli]|uniref:Uncharacterized protein n=1 Tax=Alsobacter soli TaxID=2109933 RepID=A0A2T1HLE9_9HYPH|nr:DUF6522 family protein [Alsobacter soli]PSC02477.1 hypothetical protein SLNSH_23855 [Alsobacter soli]
MTVRVGQDEVELPLGLVAELLELGDAAVVDQMRAGAITGVVERGEGSDAGRTRLTFFRGSQRARLIINSAGAVVQKSCVDYGPLARAPR